MLLPVVDELVALTISGRKLYGELTTSAYNTLEREQREVVATIWSYSLVNSRDKFKTGMISLLLVTEKRLMEEW